MTKKNEFVLPNPKRGEAAADYNIRKELAALNFVIKQLLPLNEAGRRRALAYLMDRFKVSA